MILQSQNEPNMKQKHHIVVVGSSNTDLIVQVGHIPKPGETVLGGKFVTAAGGKGANQAVAAARAGGRVTFVARVGQDAFGTQAVRGFKKDGINLKYLGRDKHYPSGTALIFVSQSGENSIAVASGANAELSAADVLRAKAAFARAKVCVLQLETPLATVQAAAELAYSKGATVILNPAPAQKLSSRLLERVTILTPNESEAELLTGIPIKGETTARRAAEKLLSRGVLVVIVTLGSRGVFVATEGVRRHVPGFKVKPVDTTAAGDVFNGALAAALAEGKELLPAVRFANAAAALSVTQQGAQPSAPSRRNIEQFLDRFAAA